MADVKIKIRVFSVAKGAEQLPELLQRIKKMETGTRNKGSSQGYVRIDDIRQRGGLWLMNFIRSRKAHGPVKVSETATEKVKYAKGQSPGEDIAVLYAPGTRYMLMQQSLHFRATPVRDYLNAVAGKPVFNLEPVQDEDHFPKFVNSTGIGMVHCQLEPRGFTDEYFEENIPGGMVLALAQGEVDVRVEMKVSVVKRGDSLSPGWRTMVEKLREMSQSVGMASKVTKLEVRVSTPDEKAEFLNLCSPLMAADVPMALDTTEWAVPLDERYDALIRQYEAWKDVLEQIRLVD